MTNSAFASGSKSYTVSSCRSVALMYLFRSEVVVTHVIRFATFRSTSCALLLPSLFPIHFCLTIIRGSFSSMSCEVARTSDASNKPSCTPSMFERDLGWRLDLCTDPVPVLAGFLRSFHHTSDLLVEWRAVKWETVLKMMYRWASFVVWFSCKEQQQHQVEV